MTILNSVDVIVKYDACSFVIPFIIAGLAFIALILGVITSAMGGEGCILLGITVVFTLVGLINLSKPIGYQYTKIEATIEDETLPADFIDKYEVLDRRGQIYVLKYIDEEKLDDKTSTD